jgi:hypothetical protein
VVLVVSELVTNALRHGTGTITLRITREPHGLVVEVADAGHGVVKLIPRSDAEDGRGWGLRIVDRLADDWGVRVSGAHVWFRLRHETAARRWTDVARGGTPHHAARAPARRGRVDREGPPASSTPRCGPRHGLPGDFASSPSADTSSERIGAWARVARAIATAHTTRATPQDNAEAFDAIASAIIEHRLSLRDVAEAYVAGAPDLTHAESHDYVCIYLQRIAAVQRLELEGALLDAGIASSPSRRSGTGTG